MRSPVTDAKPITITLEDGTRVSGLLQAPHNARACYVLAHGAGAGMKHAFMTAVASELAERGIATLRYQFPYMEHMLPCAPPSPRPRGNCRSCR
jgi:predicted alpha/beta-hydrolase family hydrolase